MNKVLTKSDQRAIAAIRKEIDKQLLIRDRASAEIQAQYARLVPFQYRCQHPNGYETSAMGDIGFRCDDCGYAR